MKIEGKRIDGGYWSHVLVIEVTDCWGCCFNEYSTCRLLSRKIEERGPMEQCPLRKGPVTVELKEE